MRFHSCALELPEKQLRLASMREIGWISKSKGSNLSLKGVRWRNTIIALAGVPGLASPGQIVGAVGGIFQNTAPTPAQFNLLGLGSGRLEQIRFWVRATGYVKLPAGAYTGTIIVTLYGVAGAAAWTAAAGNALAASAVVSIVSPTAVTGLVPWVIEADLDGDTTTGKLQGIFEGVVNNVITPRTAITNPPTGIIFTQTGTPVGGTVPSEPPLQFACGVTLTGGQATAVCNLGSLVLGAD